MPHAPFARMAHEVDRHQQHQIEPQAESVQDTNIETASSPEPSPLQRKLTAEEKGKGPKPLTPLPPPSPACGMSEVEDEWNEATEPHTLETSPSPAHDISAVEAEWNEATEPRSASTIRDSKCDLSAVENEWNEATGPLPSSIDRDSKCDMSAVEAEWNEATQPRSSSIAKDPMNDMSAIENEWNKALEPHTPTRTSTPPPAYSPSETAPAPPPYVEGSEDEYDMRPLTKEDTRDGPVFIDPRARSMKTEQTKEEKTAKQDQPVCETCLGPPGAFCEHLSLSPEVDDSMPLPAGITDRSYAEEGPNPAPQLAIAGPDGVARPAAAAAARQNSYDWLFPGQSRNGSGEFADQDFMMDPKVKVHGKKVRKRGPNLGDWALWGTVFVLALGLVVPLVVCSKKLVFTVCRRVDEKTRY